MRLLPVPLSAATGLALFCATAGATTEPLAPAQWTVTGEQQVAVDGELGPISPDGRWIAGIGPDHRFCIWEVATQDATCTGESLPIPDQATFTTMAWAPDSSAVAFDVDFARRLIDSDLYVYDVADATLTDVTDDGYDGGVILGDDVPDKVLIDVHPAWSPDSSEVLFTRLVDGAERTTTLMRIGRAGGEPTEIVRTDLGAVFPILAPPYWLADGTVLYPYASADIDDENNGIWRTDIDGTEPMQIVPGSSADEIVGPAIAAVAGGTVSLYSVYGRGALRYDGPVFWLGDVDGNIAPITAFDFDAGTPLPPDAAPADVMAAGVGRPAAPAALSPDGTKALVAYLGRSDVRLAVVDVASGTITPLELPTPLERVMSVAWVDGGVFVRAEPGDGVVLALVARS